MDRITESESWHRDVSITRHQHELVLIYFGSCWCSPCVDPEFKAALTRLKSVVAELARAEHRTFRSIGVSVDWEIEAGLRFLNESGPWDEVNIGNNWYNSSVIEHFWNQPDAKPAVPQVLLIARSFLIEGSRYVPVSKDYLVRLVGRHEVENWIGQT